MPQLHVCKYNQQTILMAYYGLVWSSRLDSYLQHLNVVIRGLSEHLTLARFVVKCESYSVVSVVPARSLVFLSLSASFSHVGVADNFGEKSAKMRGGLKRDLQLR